MVIVLGSRIRNGFFSSSEVLSITMIDMNKNATSHAVLTALFVVLSSSTLHGAADSGSAFDLDSSTSPSVRASIHPTQRMPQKGLPTFPQNPYGYTGYTLLTGSNSGRNGVASLGSTTNSTLATANSTVTSSPALNSSFAQVLIKSGALSASGSPQVSSAGSTTAYGSGFSVGLSTLNTSGSLNRGGLSSSSSATQSTLINSKSFTVQPK